MSVPLCCSLDAAAQRLIFSGRIGGDGEWATSQL